MSARLRPTRQSHETREAAITARNALIGGGSAGIGFAIAARLAPTHRTVIAGRTAGSLEQAAARLLEQTGTAVETLAADLSAPHDDALAAAAECDVLVLNAGGPPPGRILDVGDDAWRHGLGLLLLGPLALCRNALPAMARRGFGRVVFVTSTAVRQPQPDLAVSVVVRSAVTAAAKLLSREYAADGVTVNCVAPGPTDTARRREILEARSARAGRPIGDVLGEDLAAVPAGRAADPDEIAAAVEFLVSPAAGYVNGTVLTVDGGRTEMV
ncbi:SDR family oxidoreductase [Dactylosporangium sp. CA-139066]|uniref:SDR family oxidoreductase n=1 Tax=Dactylosporangium sp. CA-139066 TaxID=3239930 RepID=UPI003D92BAB9